MAGFMDLLKRAGVVQEGSGGPATPSEPVTRPDPPARSPAVRSPAIAAAATAAPHLSDADLGDLQAAVEEEIDKAAEPAFSAWMALDRDYQSDVPDMTTRSKLVLKALKHQGMDMDAVLVDIEECQAVINRAGSQVDTLRGQLIAEQVTSAETAAEAERQQAVLLRQQADALEKSAATKIDAAGRTRAGIDATHGAAKAYISGRATEFAAAASHIRSLVTPKTGQ